MTGKIGRINGRDRRLQQARFCFRRFASDLYQSMCCERAFYCGDEKESKDDVDEEGSRDDTDKKGS